MPYTNTEKEYLRKKIPQWYKKWQEKGHKIGYILELIVQNSNNEIEKKLIDKWLSDGLIQKRIVGSLKDSKRWLSKFKSFTYDKTNGTITDSNVGRVLYETRRNFFLVDSEFVQIYNNLITVSSQLKLKKDDFENIFEKTLNYIFNLLKNDIGYAIVKDLKNSVMSELNISENDYDKYFEILKTNNLLNYTIMPGRELIMIKIWRE